MHPLANARMLPPTVLTLTDPTYLYMLTAFLTDVRLFILTTDLSLALDLFITLFIFPRVTGIFIRYLTLIINDLQSITDLIFIHLATGLFLVSGLFIALLNPLPFRIALITPSFLDVMPVADHRDQRENIKVKTLPLASPTVEYPTAAAAQDLPTTSRVPARPVASRTPRV